MSTSPSSAVFRLARMTQLGMYSILVYGSLKAAVLLLDLSVPVVGSSSDPVFGALLLFLGGSWAMYSVMYARASRRSKAKSELYSTVFDHPDDAFQDGKQESKRHMYRAIVLGSIGASVFVLGVAYLVTLLL